MKKEKKGGVVRALVGFSRSVPCPFCGSLFAKVMDVRPGPGGSTLRRRRECPGGHKYTTYEEALEPFVVIDFQI